MNPHVPSKRLDELPAVQKALDNYAQTYRRRKSAQNRAEQQGLAAKAREFLNVTSLNPFVPVARVFDMIAVKTARSQESIRKALTAQGYATFSCCRIGRRNVWIVELTESAWTFIGKTPVDLRGRGGILSRHLAHWIRMVGEARGYKNCGVEWTVPGTDHQHQADAAWEEDDGFRVFECVVDCESNIVGHIEKILLRSNERIAGAIIVAPQKSPNLVRIRELVESSLMLINVQNRVSYLPAEELLKELWP